MRKRQRSTELDQAATERREFLKKFGRFAAATPPLITAVLSAPALADSWNSGGHCGHKKCKGGGGDGQGGDGRGGEGGDSGEGGDGGDGKGW